MVSRNVVLPRLVSALVVSLAVMMAPVARAAAMPYGQSESAVAVNVPNAYPGVKRVVAEINANNLAILKGNTRPEARAQFDQGAVAAEFPMKGMILVLRRSAEQQAAFDAFVQSEYETGSPNYHQWLTPDEVGERFGPAQEDIDTISQWLQSQGFTVDEVAKDRMTIRFSGTAGLVRAAFHTEIHHLLVKGEAHVANMSDPAIPAALTPVVLGVEALHNFFPRPMHRLGGEVKLDAQTHTWKRVENASGKMTDADRRAAAMSLRPDFGTGGTTSGEANIEDVAPYDFATIYNVLPLWQAATPITGAGQKIAIVATSNINLADVTAFRSAFGLPAYPSSPNPNVNQPGVSVVIPPTTTDPGDCPDAGTNANSTCVNDLVENSLDVEWAGSVATGAHIILVPASAGTGTDYTSDPVWISASYVVANKLAPIVNVSYGECELALGTAGNTGYNTLWQTAASEGIAVFVASGDEGSASCDAGLDTSTPYGAEFGLSVSGVASTPYNTAVGGTDFNWAWLTTPQSTYWNSSNSTTTLASAKGYIPESPWNATCTNSFYDALVNTQLKESLDAATICDDIASGAIYSTSGSLDFLVDIVGGSGGASACTTNDSATVASCTGGYAKPSWQAGVTGIPTDLKRDIPDVSFFASSGFSGSAYLFCVSAIVPGGACTYTSTTEPVYSEVGGTSVSSPAMAGVMALINQKNLSPFGSPNAELYKLAAKETYSGCATGSVGLTGSSCTFNDINTNTIAMPCAAGSPNCTSHSGASYGELSGYASTVGYDQATGLGSLNVANLLANFGPLTSLSPSSLTFAATLDGTTSASQPVTLSNPGTAALTIMKIGFTGTNAANFSETDNCGASLAAGLSCTINVKFSPTGGGANSASLSITDNATGSPQTVALTGTGVVPAPAVGFSSSLTFAALAVGETSSPQSVTLTNTGTASLVISSVGVTGTGATSFSQTNNCVGTVLVGETCTINVTFAPQSIGSLSAAVSVTDNASGSPQSVTLSGTGAEPVGSSYTLSAAAVSVAVGSSSSSAITATGSNGYVGPTAVTINSCTVASSPTGAVDVPTCSVTSASVTFAAGASTGSGGSVTINTTAATAAVKKAAADAHIPLKRWAGAGGAVLAFVVLLGVPARRKSWRAMLGMILLAGALATLSACGGGSSSGGGGGGGSPGTTAGAYTFTVKGTDAGGTSQSATLSVTVQ